MIGQHKSIVTICSKLINICLKSDRETIQQILSNSENELKYFNEKNNTVCDATTKEVAFWKTFVKRAIFNGFVDDITNPIDLKIENSFYKDLDFICESHRIHDPDGEWIYNPEILCSNCKSRITLLNKKREKLYEYKDLIIEEFTLAINKIVEINELKLQYIYLKRQRYSNVHYSLLEEIRQSIKTEVLSEFSKQNKQLLTKYKTI